MLIYRQSRNFNKPKHHGRRRSRSLSPSNNLKRRINARRLVALGEKEKLFKQNLLFHSKSFIYSGLHGGGKDAKMLDQEGLLESIRYAKLHNISRKKHFWETVARQYFGDLDVKKKRIDKLRLAWRRNERGICEKVNGSYKDKHEAKRKIYSAPKAVSSDSESSDSANDDVANAEATRPKIKGNDKP